MLSESCSALCPAKSGVSSGSLANSRQMVVETSVRSSFPGSGAGVAGRSAADGSGPGAVRSGGVAGITATAEWHPRVFGTAFSVFAGIALLMAAVGIYAVMAQCSVSNSHMCRVSCVGIRGTSRWRDSWTFSPLWVRTLRSTSGRHGDTTGMSLLWSGARRCENSRPRSSAPAAMVNRTGDCRSACSPHDGARCGPFRFRGR